MKNQKYKCSENAIFVAYYKMKDYPNAQKLARRANISRMTFYRHHKAPQYIPYDYEKYLLESFGNKIRTLLKREGTELKMVYLRMLIFIYTNREVIGTLLQDGRVGVIGEMIGKLKTRVILEWNLAGNLDEVFQVYAGEVLGVMVKWVKDDFSDKELEAVLNKIMFLTKTTPRRLAPLIG